MSGKEENLGTDNFVSDESDGIIPRSVD